MTKSSLRRACMLVLFFLLFSYRTVWAHESITIGGYEFEIGWAEEPPIAGQTNAIVMSVSDMSSSEKLPVEDISSLEVTVSYGGQDKALIFQPVGADSLGQFRASILPTVPGEYKITLSGKLKDTDIEAEVHPEEVQSSAVLQFPSVETPEQRTNPSSGDWLTWLAFLLGLIGVGLGASAHRKVR